MPVPEELLIGPQAGERRKFVPSNGTSNWGVCSIPFWKKYKSGHPYDHHGRIVKVLDDPIQHRPLTSLPLPAGNAQAFYVYFEDDPKDHNFLCAVVYLEIIPTAPQNSIIDCNCTSLDLFNHGCRCGFGKSHGA